MDCRREDSKTGPEKHAWKDRRCVVRREEKGGWRRRVGVGRG